MTRENEHERLREAFVEAPPDTRPAKSCPDPERIWAAVTGELPPPTFRELAAHAIDCAACSQAWALARDLAAGAELEGGQRAGSWKAWWGLAAAAAAVAVVALTLQSGRGPLPLPREDPSFRAPTEEPVRSLLPPDTVLERNGCLLRWSGPEGARYDLTVSTEDLRVLVRADGLEASEYLVARDKLTAVPAGGRLVWQVEAVLEDGTRLASRSFVQSLE